MSSDRIQVCIERAIPETTPPEEMALVVPKRWASGAELRVRFLDGDRVVRRKVQEYAEQWHEHAGIRFHFVDSPTAEIRVGFVQDGSSWSALGHDALNRDWYPPEAPTMNFGWLRPDSPEEDLARVVLHEFGHALGCVHEHQSPAGRIPWNRPAVYRYYALRGWSPAAVDENIFRKYDRDQLRFTDFDEKSIMLYPIPAELTVGGYSVEGNGQLSQTDKHFIADVYP